MPFVTIKSDTREVTGVYETQSQANAAASSVAGVDAHTGNITNNDIDIGDYINQAGHRQTTPFAAEQTSLELVTIKTRISNAFNSFVSDIPVWHQQVGTDDAQTAHTVAVRWAYFQSALALRIADGTTFTSLTDTQRGNLIDHIVKEVTDAGHSVYHRMLGISKTILNQWHSTDDTPVADGSTVYTDLVTTAGVARGPDGTRTAITGATIPTNFDPGQFDLAR